MSRPYTEANRAVDEARLQDVLRQARLESQLRKPLDPKFDYTLSREDRPELNRFTQVQELLVLLWITFWTFVLICYTFFPHETLKMLRMGS